MFVLFAHKDIYSWVKVECVSNVTWATASLAAAPTSAPTAPQASNHHLAHVFNAQYLSASNVLFPINVPNA